MTMAMLKSLLFQRHLEFSVASINVSGRMHALHSVHGHVHENHIIDMQVRLMACRLLTCTELTVTDDVN